MPAATYQSCGFSMVTELLQALVPPCVKRRGPELAHGATVRVTSVGDGVGAQEMLEPLTHSWPFQLNRRARPLLPHSLVLFVLSGPGVPDTLPGDPSG